MYPFDLYEHKGQKLLGKPKNKSNARYGYGFELLQLTKQARCAFCQVRLVDSFDHWLTLSVDHVVPAKEAERLGVPLDWREDFINLVLCCVPCNWFNNRHRILDEPRSEWDFDEFLKLRDREFERRIKIIEDLRREAREFYSSKVRGFYPHIDHSRQRDLMPPDEFCQPHE